MDIRLRNLTKKDEQLFALRPTAGLEVRLYSIMASILNEANKLIFSGERLNEDYTEIKKTLDSVNIYDLTSPFEIFMKVLQSHLDAMVNGAKTKIGNVLWNEEKRHRRAFAKSVRAKFGLDINSILDDKDLRGQIDLQIGKSIASIKGMTDDLAKKVQFTILDSAQKGQSRTALSERLRFVMQITRKRARLIARDQVGTFNGVLNKVRQEQVGIDRYMWDTMQDERVRHEHRLRQGKVFKWSNPPEDGHPGEPINCRCTAIPLVVHPALR